MVINGNKWDKENMIKNEEVEKGDEEFHILIKIKFI